jgi:hypothetical protein
VVDVITWIIAGLMLGGVGVLVAPIAAGGGPRWIRRWFGHAYGKLMMYGLDRGAVHETRQQGLKLATIDYDDDYGADRSNGGHFRDDLNVMGRLHGRLFAFAPPDIGCFVSPLVADLGRGYREEDERGRLGLLDTDNPQAGANAHVEVSANPRMASLRAARHIIPGNAQQDDADDANEMAKKSQEKFHERFSLGQTLLILAGFVVGIIGVWFVIKYGGDAAAGGGGVSIPIVLGGVLV